MLKSWLKKQNYLVETAVSVEEAKQKVKNEAYDLILSDIRMPEADGFSFLSWIKKFDSDIIVIMMTGYADIETAVESIKSGAVDYIAKPIEEEALYKKIAEALKSQKNQKKAEQIRDSLIKPRVEAYREVFDKLDEMIHNESHLLIVGEHGTGKTSAAKYVYSKNGKDSAPFVVVDLDPQIVSWNSGRETSEQLLLESLEKAKGGILLIKDLQQTDINVQTTLLNVLTSQKKDENFTRIVITTRENKENLKSKLLPKLAELLDEYCVEMPNLQGNREAILFYTEYFLELANKELDKEIVKIDKEVFDAFFNHTWTGNIQELKNVIFKATLLTDNNTISKNILPMLFNRFVYGVEEATTPSPKQFIEGLKKENYEKEKIEEALEISKGNKTMAASILNIDRKTLYNKIKLYNVEVN